MTEKEFEERVLELLEENYDPSNSADEDILDNLKSEVEARNGGRWGDGMAREVMREFEWLLAEAKKTRE